MDILRRQAILEQLAAWLERCGDDDPLPEGLDPNLPDDAAPAGHAELVAALTAVRGELQMQGKAFMRLCEQLEASRRNDVQSAAARAREETLQLVLHHHDRLWRVLGETKQACAGLGWWARRSAAAHHLLAVAEALELTYATLLDELDRFQVRPADPVGQPFDAQRMRAIASVVAQPGVADGTVVETVRRGFMLGHAVLRPAEVKVARHRTDSIDLEGLEGRSRCI
ncbi:MAG: nucleotide exchange factor GrpE [Planctomycetota bacterium]